MIENMVWKPTLYVIVHSTSLFTIYILNRVRCTICEKFKITHL